MSNAPVRRTPLTPQVGQLFQERRRIGDRVTEIAQGLIRCGLDYALVCHTHRWVGVLDVPSALTDCPLCEAERAAARGRKRYDSLIQR
jgi:hypothetical protein